MRGISAIATLLVSAIQLFPVEFYNY